jgi:hypothetical protein
MTLIVEDAAFALDNFALDNKVQQIEKVLKVLDRTFGPLTRTRVMIAGGFINSLFGGELNDVDIFPDPSFKQQLFDKLGSLNIEQKIGKYGVKATIEGFNFDFVGLDKGSDPIEVLETFDMVHCCVGYYCGKLIFHPDWYNCIANNAIEITEPTPATWYRILKYLQRGYTISQEELTKAVSLIQTKQTKQ